MESPSRYRDRDNVTSPTSPTRQIPKSAFFRTKSPQTGEERSLPSLPGLQPLPEEDRSEWLRRMQRPGKEDGLSVGRNGDAYGLRSVSTGSPQATLGHSPAMNDRNELPKSRGQSNVRAFDEERPSSETTYSSSLTSSSSSLRIPPVNRSNSRYSTADVGRSDTVRQRELERERYTEPSSSTHTSNESTGMMASLLANQAALDCENMPTARWDEVDEWKKELTMLTSRLHSSVARHQREQKILTAAKTLAKLNGASKRLSKQTMESLDVAEKKAADAEKDMLVLRYRENELRRQLMEHWAGSMAREVKILSRAIQGAEERVAESVELRSELRKMERLPAQVESLEQDLKLKDEKIRAMETRMEAMKRSSDDVQKELSDARGHKDKWDSERRELQQLVKEGQAHADRWQTARRALGETLQRDDLQQPSDVIEVVKKLRTDVKHKDEELAVIKSEMREVGMGMEDELRRMAADRDALHSQVERLSKEGGQEDEAKSRQIAEYEQRLLAPQRHADQLASLQAENRRLQEAAKATSVVERSAVARTAGPSQDLTIEVQSLREERANNDLLIGKLWNALPNPATRRLVGPIDIQTGNFVDQLASPGVEMNFDALRALYSTSREREEQHQGLEKVLDRVKLLLADAQLLAQRVARASGERSLWKDNATKAKRLAEDSGHHLQTYQQQVATLQARMKSASEVEKTLSDQVSEMRPQVASLESAKRLLEADAIKQAEICDRLSEANDKLSQNALSMAEDTQQEKKAMQLKLESQIAELKMKLQAGEEDMEEMRTREQTQRIQLLDELNSLQGETTRLRQQLRAVQLAQTPP